MEKLQYNITDTSKLDREVRELISIHSSLRLKSGLELARRLYEIEKNKLYSKLDEKAFPSFVRYLKSLDINYRSARELIGIYVTYVLVGGYTIDELAEISYHKLAVIKAHLFEKKNGEYSLIKSKKETDKWVKELKSDISIEDLRQKRIEDEVGEHEHEWEEISFLKCRLCKIKSYTHTYNKLDKKGKK